jgi:hypothetical protein
MRYLLFILLLATPALASSSHEAVAGSSPATSHYSFVPIPGDPSWIGGTLLLALWLTVAAIILGPLVKYFNLMPKTRQVFSDSGHGHSHSAAHTTSH